MDAPAISVLVTVYNTSNYLPQCLGSIKNQSFPDFEVICIDDGSTDNSPDILIEFANDDPRFKVHNQENRGVGYTKNRALMLAEAPYVFFLDSDDFIEEDTLQSVYLQAKRTEAQIVVFPYDIYHEDSGDYEPNPVTVNERYIPEGKVFSASDIPETIFQTLTPEVCNKLWLRSFLLENNMHLGGYHYAEDYFLTYWALAIAERIAACPDKAYYHYRKGRPDSLTAISDDEPLAFMEAYGALKDKLLALGLYERLEQSYLNLTLSGIHYEYWKLMTDAGRTELENHLRNEGFARLGIKDYGKQYFYDESDYACYRQILYPPGTAQVFIHVLRGLPKRTIRYLKKYGLKATLQRIIFGRPL